MKTCVYLIGFMGVGKTTVAKELSGRLRLPLVDTDEAIVEREGRSIPEIFEREGEKIFREKETRILRDLSESGAKIISCGGGIAMREENRDIMAAHGVTVLLKASPETILERVKGDDNRPLLAGKKKRDSHRRHDGRETPCLRGGGEPADPGGRTYPGRDR